MSSQLLLIVPPIKTSRVIIPAILIIPAITHHPQLLLNLPAITQYLPATVPPIIWSLLWINYHPSYSITQYPQLLFSILLITLSLVLLIVPAITHPTNYYSIPLSYFSASHSSLYSCYHVSSQLLLIIPAIVQLLSYHSLVSHAVSSKAVV